MKYLGHKKTVNRETIRNYLNRFNQISSYSYSNILKPIKIYFRDYLGSGELVSSFRFPKKPFRFNTVPNKEELRR